jgi:hypothetical protein
LNILALWEERVGSKGRKGVTTDPLTFCSHSLPPLGAHPLLPKCQYIQKRRPLLLVTNLSTHVGERKERFPTLVTMPR